ncbi:hypothetical protein LCGC14_2700540 [marine sediment metagenome]|uniref:Uncharacterized protein n=1 Tax=marine sediment metagenome TaxID=412755 RepID=A0A0F8ZFY4_9ZZZZ
MQYLAGFIELLAKIVVGRKCRWGFVIHLIGSLLWTIVALTAPMYGLLIITIPATFVNIYNYFRWKKEDEE